MESRSRKGLAEAAITVGCPIAGYRREGGSGPKKSWGRKALRHME